MGICPSIAKALNLEAFHVSFSQRLDILAWTHANTSLTLNRPWHHFRRNFDVPLIEWNPRIRLMEMYVWGNNCMFKDVYRFDNTSQTRRGFEVADLQTRQPCPWTQRWW